jgi:hypothetical protein
MEKGQTFRDVAFLLIGKFRSALRIFLSGLSQLDFDLGSIWCIEDGSDIGRNFPASFPVEAHTDWRSAASGTGNAGNGYR